jgi:putative ABC transport system ATP-binding protein
VIELVDLRFRWPGSDHDTLVVDALHIASGESVFLHGPSGCGKSTLLGLLAGVQLPRQGRVQLLGTCWGDLSPAKRDAFRADHVGYIFQQFNLLTYLSVLDNVLLPCRFSAARRSRAVAAAGSERLAAEHLLERVGLERVHWGRPASGLSVGQQQRVAAARALIGTPELVIADEPTSALDAGLRDAFMALLRHQCALAGSTLVFVSHDERLADRFDRRLALPHINRATIPAAEEVR